MVPRRLSILPFFIHLILVCGSRSGAEDLRFVSLRPSGTGEWTATLTGRGAKNPASLAFWADGQPIAAETAGTDGDRVRLKLKGVPAGVSRIEAGSGKEKSAAVGVGAEGPEAGPFDDWILYHIMVEMFANGSTANDREITGWKHPNYAGGDLQGILERAEHIQRLGANAVWLSPIFAARTSHGYDVTNYYKIGSAVGVPGDPAASLDLFHRLVKDLHSRGIRVILDVPLNHASAGYERPAGDPDNLRPRATAARQEAEKLWESWGADYRYWDFDHPPTRQFLKNAALYWLTREDVDGLRLDYVRGVAHDFWAELYTDVKHAKPGAFLVGEAWIDQQGQERNAQDGASYFEKLGGSRQQFDSLFDFAMQMTLTAVFAQGGPAADLETWLQRSEAIYGPGTHPTRFLDNHDLARFMSWTDRPARLTAALGFLASLTGPIAIFCGTEAGLSHVGPKAGFTDAGRIPMPWKELDAGLVSQIGRILQTRREHPVLSRGGRIPLLADRDQLVMAKVTPEETVLVGVNLAGEPKEVSVDVSGLLAGSAALQPLLGESSASLTPESHLRWKLPALSTVMVAAKAVGPGR
ncbi:MAG TPA: alpha-amylase family glycosyl hydrolase [Thermoanaerobaculia bacterium]|jgi:glycosidase|nr:alpha-amylase family glycosyl hydrolase [Thermoanaerobaculia bacterium]